MFKRRAAASCYAPQASYIPHGTEESRAAGGAQLRTLLLSLYTRKQLSAKDLCLLSHWHVESGGEGLDDFAVRPGVSTGNYSKHLELVLSREFPQCASLYRAKVPMMEKKTGIRTHVGVPFSLPIDFLLARHGLENCDAETIDMSSPLGVEHAEVSSEWTPAYQKHPVVKKALEMNVHPSRIRPGGLYMDGAMYSKRDVFEGLWFHDLRSGRRELICVIRKDDLCDCGCKGWCSMFIIHWVICWNLICAAHGINPDLRHEGSCFSLDPSDAQRFLRRGKQLPFVIPLLELRADWPGYTGPMGFRGHNHKTASCVCCNVLIENISDTSNVSLDSGPWVTWTNSDYREEVERSRTTRLVDTEAMRARIGHALVFDRRKKGGCGRLIRVPLPEFNLVAGDRLDPSPALPDVHRWRLEGRDRC